MATSTITSRGQTTIPQDIRKRMHLKEGDRIEWVERDDGHLEVIPVTLDASQVAGKFKDWVTLPVSINKMNDVKKSVASRYSRGLK